MDGKQLERWYKDYLSDYSSWNQRSHAAEYILYPKNFCHKISIDETSLSCGELYTIITGKDAKGRKGAVIAIIKGVCSENIIDKLLKISYSKRKIVNEVTVDMSASLNKVIRLCFPQATVDP